MPTNTDPLLTRDEVADLLRVSRRTVERMEDSGQLQAIRIGRQVRYRRADVDALISDAS